MFPLSGLAGGMSVSDSTSVNFDPFADQRKTGSNTISVKSSAPLSVETIMPILLVGIVVYLVYRLFK